MFEIDNKGRLQEINSVTKAKENVEILEIPENVKEITAGACSGWYGVKKVILKPGLKIIGKKAFDSCGDLEEINIPDTVTEIGEDAFHLCSHLKKIEIPNSVTRINKGTFYACDSLEEVYLPDSIKEIDEKAFYYCKSLKTINLPQNTKFIGLDETDTSSKESFYGPVIVKINPDSPYYAEENDIVYDKDFKEIKHIPHYITGVIEIHEGIKIASPKQFRDLKVDSIVLPSSVTVIDNTAFFGSSIKTFKVPETVQSIGYAAFRDCKELKKVEIKGKTKILDGTFWGCEKLEEVKLNDGLEIIGKNTFAKCKKLREITIPEGVKIIDKKAFQNCKLLERIVIPDSVEQIHVEAFKGCDALAEGSVPENLIVSKIK